VKLLLDENLSPGLVDQLAVGYPDSKHADTLGLHGEPDDHIWSFAREHDYVLVSKAQEALLVLSLPQSEDA
jgi:predicted nuclease of predicted toxin-antitoxin system